MKHHGHLYNVLRLFKLLYVPKNQLSKEAFAWSGISSYMVDLFHVLGTEKLSMVVKSVMTCRGDVEYDARMST